MLTIGAIENNGRALHVYRDKLGFTYEGLLRRRKYKDGAYFGEHILSITREEWLVGKGK